VKNIKGLIKAGTPF